MGTNEVMGELKFMMIVLSQYRIQPISEPNQFPKICVHTKIQNSYTIFSIINTGPPSFVVICLALYIFYIYVLTRNSSVGFVCIAVSLSYGEPNELISSLIFIFVLRSYADMSMNVTKNGTKILP